MVLLSPLPLRDDAVEDIPAGGNTSASPGCRVLIDGGDWDGSVVDGAERRGGVMRRFMGLQVVDDGWWMMNGG